MSSSPTTDAHDRRRRSTRTRRCVAVAALALAGCTRPSTSRPVAAATPVVAPKPTDLEELRSSIDSMVAAPQFRNAHWGILIVDPERGDTLYSHNAGKLFMPASNQKILTASTALAQLGPDYRYRTTYATRGRVRNGVLEGDLVVVGRGDPSVSDHMRGDAMLPLLGVADSLIARGIHRITGRVVSGGNAFPDEEHGYGWAWDDFGYAYSAGVDELMFNEGFMRVIVRGGPHAGDRPTVTMLPAHSVMRLDVDSLQTIAARMPQPGDSPETMPVTRTDIAARVDAPGARVVVTGTVLAGDSTTEEVAFPEQTPAFLAALSEALTERGVTIGHAMTPAARTPTSVDTLFTVFSPPLREIMPALQKPSQNQIAEILLKTLGLERTGVGTADSGRRVVEAQLRAWGAEPDGYVVRDGSGLSRHDYVSPETIVRVLAAVRRDTAFAVFYDALPIAGVDGTIATRMRNTPAQGNLHAKTGFIDKARSLSGYVTTADGRQLVFSVLCNNWTTPVRAVERVQDEIGARLAAMTLGAAGTR